jgi:hypothetical protein
VPLLEALRALSAFDAPAALPAVDPALLGDLLDAHGLAPLASWHLEHARVGASAPEALRERLLTAYQGVVNDNLEKVMGLRGLLREVEGLRIVLLDAAAYLDWLYPHLAFRPLGDVRLGVSAEDGSRLIERLSGEAKVVRLEHEGRTAVLVSDKVKVTMQEGLWAGGAADGPLFERARRHPVFGPSAYRPSPEDALLSTVAEQALLGLFAPLVTFVDVRELLKEPLDAPYLAARAAALGLDRALHGATLLVAHYFPETAEAAARVRPALGTAERIAVERIVEAAKDPAKLRHVRGAEEAARAVVAPRRA